MDKETEAYLGDAFTAYVQRCCPHYYEDNAPMCDKGMHEITEPLIRRVEQETAANILAEFAEMRAWDDSYIVHMKFFKELCAKYGLKYNYDTMKMEPI